MINMSASGTLVKENNILGEGLFVGKEGIFWVDIISAKLFTMLDNGSINSYKLPEQASAIWKIENNIVYLICSQGICTFDLITKGWHSLSTFAEPLDNKSRANDGAEICPDRFLFGTMEKSPTGLNGSLYSTNGNIISKIYDGIGIPNTFIKVNECSFLISDSLLGKIYEFTFNSTYSKVVGKKLWLDLEEHGYTPDGGCIDESGNIYIAMWDGACINQYDKSANLIKSFPVAALKPTNCKLAMDNQSLIVTTATEGMSKAELEAYPMSGSLLEIRIV